MTVRVAAPVDLLRRGTHVALATYGLGSLVRCDRFILFSDEAHFWLNGFVNKQNMRYWSATNPNVLLETLLHPQKVYANKPATLDNLIDNIQCEIVNVPAEMCAIVVENWVQRIEYYKRARGGHMTDIEFYS